MAVTRKNKLMWVIGGAQGSGVDSAATMFARAVAFGGFYIYGQREYYSNIMGEHSYFQIRAHERVIRSTLERIDLLASFDAETVFMHALEVEANGGIIYNPKLESIPVERVATMDRRARADTQKYLKERGLGDTLGDILKDAHQRGVILFPIPYDALIKQLAEAVGETQISKLKRNENTMAVAASCAILNYPMEYLVRAFSDVFKGKKKVIDLSTRAAEIVFNHIKKQHGGEFSVVLEPIPTDEPRIYITGNQATALGKIAGGCTFQTYYPISPATDESTYLEAHETFPEDGVVSPEHFEAQLLQKEKTGSILVVQTEDEIAAVCMATGAALAGARASTATSGPGFCLMTEAIGWAAINEVPLVITLYQRGSPSTGMPTRHEQGDLRFAIHAGHGESPRIIFASGDSQEAFYDAARSFNYAERYQTPVIHMLDKALASSAQTYRVFDTSPIKIERGKLLSEADLEQISHNGGYMRFKFVEDGISPRSIIGQKGGIFWNTGDEHHEDGHITEDPVVRVNMMNKRAKKLEIALKEIPAGEKFTFYGDPKAELLLVSWGTTKGAILDAMERMEVRGLPFAFLQVRLLCPFPAVDLEPILTRHPILACVECNYSGQFAGIIREQTGIAVNHHVVKFNGRPMSMGEICDAVRDILAKKAPRRLVLTRGA
ncbi:MAG: 2-oxoacid:acceptor oxidoreductase family protein [bacterium]